METAEIRNFKKEGTQYVIGFGGLLYTLWTLYTYKNYFGDEGQFNWAYKYTYHGNLSQSLEEAEKKVVEMGISDYVIDEDLRGEKWSLSEYEKANVDPSLFAVGKYYLLPISECNDVSNLYGAYLNDDNPRRKVYARRRLIELGELVKCTWIETKYGSINSYEVKRNWMPVKMYEGRKKWDGVIFDHFYNEGERVELNLRELKETGFETAFGWMYIITYRDEQNRIFKYKGNNPPDITKEDNQFTAVKGTIKHNEYKGKKETYIQRIKLNH